MFFYHNKKSGKKNITYAWLQPQLLCTLGSIKYVLDFHECLINMFNKKSQERPYVLIKIQQHSGYKWATTRQSV